MVEELPRHSQTRQALLNHLDWQKQRDSPIYRNEDYQWRDDRDMDRTANYEMRPRDLLLTKMDYHTDAKHPENNYESVGDSAQQDDSIAKLLMGMDKPKDSGRLEPGARAVIPSTEDYQADQGAVVFKLSDESKNMLRQKVENNYIASTTETRAETDKTPSLEVTQATKSGSPAAEELSKSWLPTEFIEPLVNYFEANPLMAALYLTMLVVILTLAAYKCKFYRRFCNRRRRRRRKPRTHYYYLN